MYRQLTPIVLTAVYIIDCIADAHYADSCRKVQPTHSGYWLIVLLKALRRNVAPNILLKICFCSNYWSFAIFCRTISPVVVMAAKWSCRPWHTVTTKAPSCGRNLLWGSNADTARARILIFLCLSMSPGWLEGLVDVEFEVVLMYLLETTGRSYFDNLDMTACGISGSRSIF